MRLAHGRYAKIGVALGRRVWESATSEREQGNGDDHNPGGASLCGAQCSGVLALKQFVIGQSVRSVGHCIIENRGAGNVHMLRLCR